MLLLLKIVFFFCLMHLMGLVISAALIGLRHGRNCGLILRRQAWLLERNLTHYEFPDPSVVEKCVYVAFYLSLPNLGVKYQ